MNGYFSKSILRFIVSLSLLVLVATPLASCDMARNQFKTDRAGDKQMQDYRDALAPRMPDPAADAAGSDGSPIPGLQPYVAAAPASMKSMPLVSISVNQSVPLRDILFELAQQANYDIELDPRITGSIIFTARERPFDEVIQRIADVAGLRYNFDNDVLRVELDSPYGKVYKIDYLSYVRSNKGSVRNNIGVVSGDGGANTGSEFESSSESEANFWGELEQNLNQMIGGSVSGALKTKRTPQVTATEQNPNVQAVSPPVTDANGNTVVQPPQATLQVNSLPTDEEEEAPTEGASGNPTGSTFTINKQAGLVNIYAPEKIQKEIESYLKILRKSVTAQVLIEAKVLEVSLADKYATGIDWRMLDIASGEGVLSYVTGTAGSTLLNGLGGRSIGLPARLLPGVADADITGGLVVGYAGNDVQALIRAVSQFGTVKALASPRLTVLNNQSAVLNVATNHVYFDVDISIATSTETGRQVDVSSDAHNVPVGVLVNVQPSINLENHTIAMAVRPTVTRISNNIEDPAVQFVAASADPPVDISSTVPELNVQEIDSVIQVRSGQPIVMGGLLQDRSESQEDGVPMLSETPIIGSLFKQHGDTVTKTELVIFLKATILEAPEDFVDNTDKDMYRTFAQDRHPLKL